MKLIEKNSFFKIYEYAVEEKTNNLEKIPFILDLPVDIVNFMYKYTDCYFSGNNFDFTMMNPIESNESYKDDFANHIKNGFPFALNNAHHFLFYFLGNEKKPTGLYIVDMKDVDLEESIFICSTVEDFFNGKGLEIISNL